MALEKARVQLLNPDTGAVVSEVDILSTASCISYINDTKTIRDFRGIPAGTTFKSDEEFSVKDILDKILYPHEDAEVGSIASVDGKEITEDTIVYKEKFYPIESFDYTARIKAGNLTRLTFTLKRYNNVSGEVSTISNTITVSAGSEYLYTQTIENIEDDTSLQLSITDGESTTTAPTLEFKFIYPVYVGYCDADQFAQETDSNNIVLNTLNASDYFNTLIANKSNLIKRQLLPVQDINSFNLTDPIYSDKEYNLCILYPNTWHKVEAIIDCNDDIVTGAYRYNNQLSIKPDNNEVHKVQYTAYVSTDKYNPQLAAAGSIVYKFELGTGSIDYGTVGSPSLVGFDPVNHHPLDLRTEVSSYENLKNIQYKYDGMVVFVHDIHSYFRYDLSTDMWINTNQEFLFGNSIPTLDLGKSGDIYINISTGHIYQKYKDIRWEDKGIITVNLSDDLLKAVDIWQSGYKYQPGDYVYWDDKYWKAQYETTSEPGTDNTWVETKPTLVQGADGDPGEAATIEIADVLVAETVDDADVINLGDKFHARFRFIVPRGPKGEKGDPGETADISELKNVVENNTEKLNSIQLTLTTHENNISKNTSDIAQLEATITELEQEITKLKAMIPTKTTQEGSLLTFLNSSNKSLFTTTVANGIPIMIDGELDYTDAKTAYLEANEDTADCYIMNFM